MKRKLTAPRVRNHLVVPAIKRKAGAHRKSGKAQRRDEQMDHLKEVAHFAHLVNRGLATKRREDFHKRAVAAFL